MKHSKGREALVSVTSMDWALWLIPAALVPLILLGLFILASMSGSLASAHLAVPQIAFDVVQYSSKALIVVALFFIGMEFTRQTVKNLQGRVVWYALLLWAAIVLLTLLAALNFA